MRRWGWASILLVILVSISCANLPVTKAQPESAGIGIIVKVKTLLPIFPNELKTVYFVRLEDTTDSVCQYPVVKSNYESGDYVYLLNIKHGRYAAVAASRKRGDFVLFPEKTIRNTVTTVGPGKLSFMGRHIVKEKFVDMTETDTVQQYYLKLLTPEQTETSTFQTFKKTQVYPLAFGESDRSDNQEELFVNCSRQCFKGTTWESSLAK